MIRLKTKVFQTHLYKYTTKFVSPAIITNLKYPMATHTTKLQNKIKKIKNKSTTQKSTQISIQYVQYKHSQQYIISKKPQILQLIHKKLYKIFQSPSNITQLAKTFRIFPSYFSKNIVNNLLQSEYIDQYVQYILTRKSIKEQFARNQEKSQELKKLLQKLNIQQVLQNKILQIYINYVKRTRDLTQSQILMQIFDLRNPQNWFKSKISAHRKFIYHHGPTNSGKTYSAINQLRNLRSDQKGIYMAPLRLLAWQTQQKLGKCNLVTGQQKDYQNSNLTSCTIQAVNMTEKYDVAIIDQIQMIGDQDRGHAWTSPILGIKANKIHLCGDQRAINLISKLIDKSGGSLQQKQYRRLSKLHLIKRSFKLSDLRPGDCIIDFSSPNLYKYREKINTLKGTPQQPNKAAIIYGKLPPNCRKYQAQKFNNGQLPYLVASDAIGMGLNLKIRRIIFVNLIKMGNDKRQKILQDHQIRQIAGRAGRGYGHGYVQCANIDITQRVKYALRNVNLSIQQNQNIIQNNQQTQQSTTTSDNSLPLQYQQKSSKFQFSGPSKLKIPSQQKKQQSIINQKHSQLYNTYLQRYLKYDETKIQRGGILYPLLMIQRIKLYMQRILKRTLKISQTANLIIQISKQNQQLYFITRQDQFLQLSDILQQIQLPFHIHYLFASVPLPKLNSKSKQILTNYAKQFKYQGQVKIPVQIQHNYNNNFEKFKQLKSITQLQQQFTFIQIYTWLWNHLELYFPYNDLAIKIKNRICQKMNQILLLPRDYKVISSDADHNRNFNKQKRYNNETVGKSMQNQVMKDDTNKNKNKNKDKDKDKDKDKEKNKDQINKQSQNKNQEINKQQKQNKDKINKLTQNQRRKT